MALTSLLSELPADVANDVVKRRREARKLMKDAIEAYCDKKRVEAEATATTKAKQYDWEALEYRYMK